MPLTNFLFLHHQNPVNLNLNLNLKQAMWFQFRLRVMLPLPLSACTSHLSTHPSWVLLLSSLGFLSFLIRILIPLLNWVYATFLRPTKNLKSYGSWALITGATDGIGKAFATQLAHNGLNIILVGRNPNKLKKISNEIQAEYRGTKVKTVVFDFLSNLATGDESVLGKAIEGLDVGVLINNVGITYPAARFFHEVDEQVWMDIVRVNLEGTTRVTRAVLPGMIQRRRGAIVNIGSGAGTVLPSHPLFTIYAATKAYIDQLSRCLYVEYKKCGIHVQCQVPLYVATKMTSTVALIQRPSFFIPSPEDYAKASITRIGYEAQCTPYWSHSLQCCLTRFLPDYVLDDWRFSIGIHRRKKSFTFT